MIRTGKKKYQIPKRTRLNLDTKQHPYINNTVQAFQWTLAEMSNCVSLPKMKHINIS